MKKIYHLANCTTCQRILKEWAPGPEVVLQEIKTEPITVEQIEQIHALSGSYERLFSRRAMKYRAMGLGEKNLTEEDYKQLIVDEYTFLKRPVMILADQIFIGNTKKVVEAGAKALNEE